MLKTLLLLLAVHSTLGEASGARSGLRQPAREGTGCPIPEADAEARIHRLLRTPLIAELRARYDFGSAAADEVRLLTDENDRETCESLHAAVAESGANLTEADRVSFYQSGDRYLVPVTRFRSPERTGTIHFDGHSSVDIYDSHFRLIGRFMA